MFLRGQHYSALEENRLIFFFSHGPSDYQINGHASQNMSKARNNGKSARDQMTPSVLLSSAFLVICSCMLSPNSAHVIACRLDITQAFPREKGFAVSPHPYESVVRTAPF